MLVDDRVTSSGTANRVGRLSWLVLAALSVVGCLDVLSSSCAVATRAIGFSDIFLRPLSAGGATLLGRSRGLRQFLLQDTQLLGELLNPVEFIANRDTMFPVHRHEHLHHENHVLMKRLHHLHLLLPHGKLLRGYRDGLLPLRSFSGTSTSGARARDDSTTRAGVAERLLDRTASDVPPLPE